MASTECWFTSLCTLPSVWRSYKSVQAKTRPNKTFIHWLSVVLIFLVMLDSHWTRSIQSQPHPLKLVSCKIDISMIISLHCWILLPQRLLFIKITKLPRFSIEWFNFLIFRLITSILNANPSRNRQSIDRKGLQFTRWEAKQMVDLFR